MSDQPYLKPACAVDERASCLRITYRGRAYAFDAPADAAVHRAVAAMDGRSTPAEIARRSGLDAGSLSALVAALHGTPLLLDGAEVIRPDGLSGTEAHWRLEGELWHWRSLGHSGDHAPASEVDREIAKGAASEAVVKGYCLEICHQVSNAPTEIALAIANAPGRKVRDLFMEFYEDEHAHGDMLREALSTWLPEAGIDAATPLPATAGLLHSYDQWAQSDVLRYAVALMRDEGSALDAPVTEAADIYLGMERHYDVPAAVVERFRWHANLDVELGHGSFPLAVFAQFPLVDGTRYAQLAKVARTIVELYDSLMREILAYYTAHPVESRWPAAR
jgi:pyrroloquinoline quinone (PQQ) biosynthesis protein C